MNYLACMLCLLLAAASGEAANGRSSLFSLGFGGRSTGLGTAGAAGLFDQSAVYANPALLPELEYQQAALSHTQLFESSIFNSGAYVLPISDRQAVGLGYTRIGSSQLERYDDYRSTGTFSFSQTQYQLSYGRQLNRPLRLGGSVKFSQQQLGELSDFGIAVDIGAVIRLSRQLHLALVGRDLIPAEYKLDETVESLSRTGVVAIAVTDLWMGGSTTISLLADLEKTEQQPIAVRAGGELSLGEQLFVRGGYDRERPTAGIGLRYQRLQFDYGIRFLETIDDHHAVSLSVRIGPSMTERRERAELERRRLSGEFERMQRFEANKARGKELFDRFQLDSALVYYQRALAFDESNQELIGTIAAIERSRAIQQEQETRLREMLAEERQSIRTSYDQASQLVARGHYRAALDLLDLIFEVQPDNSQALELKLEIERAIAREIDRYLQSGDSALRLGQSDAAIEAYNRVLNLDSSNVGALAGRKQASAGIDLARQLNMGIAAFTSGNLDEARRLFREVLRVNPNEQVARNYLNRIENPSNTTVEPRPAGFDELQQDPVYWPLYLEGLRHMRSKEYQKAIDVWTRVLQAYPENKNTIDNIAQARLRLQGSTTPR